MLNYSYTEETRFGHLEVAQGIRFFMNHELEQAEHAAHSHNYLELAFILGGSARHLTVKGESICQQGDLIVIPKGAWHGYSDCRKLEVVNCLFSPQLLSRELAWLEDDPELACLLNFGHYGLQDQVFKIEVRPEDRKAVRKGLLDLESVYQAGGVQTLLLASMLQLLEQLRASCRLSSLPSRVGAELHPSVVRALRLFREQMDAEWRLDVMANQLRLNPSYLVRLFREQVGESPMAYLSRIRAEQAANCLLATRLRVGEIGYQVGWSDPKVFSRNFRRHFGMRASDYRKRMLRSFV